MSDERENLIERRRILPVTLLAVEQAARVLEVCASASGDNASLVRALAKAFEISDFEAEGTHQRDTPRLRLL